MPVTTPWSWKSSLPVLTPWESKSLLRLDIFPLYKAEVQIIENTYIELSDGVKLSTRLWLPTTAGGDNPVPAIFEFLPYRKRDVTAQRDEVTYQVFAKNGYVCLLFTIVNIYYQRQMRQIWPRQGEN